MSKPQSERARDLASMRDACRGRLGGLSRLFVLAGVVCFVSLSAAATSSPAAPDLDRSLAIVKLGQSDRLGSIAGRAEADLNGDGILDYAEVTRVPLEITLRLSGAPSRHMPLLEPALAVAVVDLDRDGDRDVVAVSGSLHMVVWWNDGFGAFDLRSIVLSGLLAPRRQAAPELVDLFVSPVLPFARPSHVATAVPSGSPTFRMAPGTSRHLYEIASPRAPPTSRFPG